MKLTVLLICLGLGCLNACKSQVNEKKDPSTSSLQTKDLITFKLPQEVLDVSPIAQEHFLNLLPYNTARFEVKPRFVFLDRAEMINGPMNMQVDRLNFLHVVYFRENTVIWRGSALYGLQESPLFSTRESFFVGVKPKDDLVEVSFQDVDRLFKAELPKDRDVVRWLEKQDSKIFIYHYVFPESLQAKAP